MNFKPLTCVLLLSFFFVSCGNQPDKAVAIPEVKPLTSPATGVTAEPWLFTDATGTVYLSWIEKQGKISLLRFSSFRNNEWSEPITIQSGENWFVNWADYPVVVSDGKNNLVAHYLEKSAPGKYTYDIKLTSSADNGKTWITPSVLHDDGKQAEHGFVSIVPYGEDFFVSWLDGRNSVMPEGTVHEGHHGQMTLRTAVINNKGEKLNEWEADERVCDCCQTSAAITSSGPVVVYRDRSADEIRDISIIRYINNTWTMPRSIYADNWKIDGCPVNGPRVDAIGNNLAVAWYTKADDTAQVKLVFSANGGESFDAPIRIDEGNPLGRIDLILLDKETALVSWMEGAEIKVVNVHRNRQKGIPVSIASSSEARSSGFPQMTRQGNQIIFAWTDDKAKTIRVSSFYIAAKS